MESGGEIEALLTSARRARAEVISGALRGAALLERIASLSPCDRDTWVDGLCGIDPPPPDSRELPRGAVPYLPCGVEEILALVGDLPVLRDDVFVDLGSGLGRVCILAHLLSGARCLGVEIQGHLVERARATSTALGLSEVSFCHADAATTDLDGSVFFLYAPFNGALLSAVIRRLQAVAQRRPIRIGTIDLELPDLPWLRRRVSSRLSMCLYDTPPIDTQG